MLRERVVKFSFEFSLQFALEFENYTVEQRRVVLEFLKLYTQYGLKDFSIYQGKISPFWRGRNISTEVFDYAYRHQLWHYHIGLPKYMKSKYADYYTSDWVLHFIWEQQGTHIIVVDLCYHYKSDGTFHLPSKKYLQI